MAHGYEELVTPLQMLMVYNAIANDGKIMKPYLVNSVSQMGTVIQEFKPEVLEEQICSKETLQKVKACLLAVVENQHGTARSLKSPYYLFGGKTGTAVTAMDNRGYNKGNKIYQSAFMGFFPYDNPEYSIAVVIQNGYDSKWAYGGTVAGPVFKEVADRIYATRMATIPVKEIDNDRDSAFYRFSGLGTDLNQLFAAFHYGDTKVDNKQKWALAYLRQGKAHTITNPALQDHARVPDVLGMGLKDAVYLLENRGLKVDISGKGKVVKQSLLANTSFNKGDKINLELN